MSRKSYWLACLEEILGEHKVELDPAVVCAIADDLAGCAEMESEALGHTNIPNPLDARIRELEDDREREQKEAADREWLLRSNIARRVGVDPIDVAIHNGRVEIWPI
jgi:hypothetical protein